MAFDLALTARIIGPVVGAVAPPLLKGIQSQLNPDELQKALKAGIEAAQTREEDIPGEQHLFYKSAPDFIEKFLKAVFLRGKEELQKPLKREGMPDVSFLVEIFQQVAAEHPQINPQETRIQPWLHVFVNAYFEKTNTYLRFKVAKRGYCQAIAEWFDDVKFAGIAVPGQEVEKSGRLAQIFVMPDVLEEVQSHPRSQLEHQPSGFINWGGISNMVFNKITRSGRRFSAAELLTQTSSRKQVLLGAPGGGKTTLMSYVAVMLARDEPQVLGLATDTDWLPILIRIRELARYEDIGILDYARQFAEKTMAVKELPAGFFEYWLEDGRSLILLDGLDEVAQEAKRYGVVRRIESFLRQFSLNRAIITSRPAGYKRDFFRTEEFPHYQLQPFDDPKIETFIRCWYDSRVRDGAEARRRQESLQKALDDNDRIKLLARNPLLLTIIALIHRYQALLPKERYKLYDKAVETLLTSWDANKELSGHQVLKYLDADDLRRLMEYLAYWIHSRGSGEESEGGTLIGKDELISQLRDYIQGQKQIERHKAKEEAKRFVGFIRERTGLLNEQGTDCYAFVHKTFQEYLCAQEIDYQQDNEGDFEIVLGCIREHLHDPHWREVLLLSIGQQKPKKAVKAIQAILNDKSEYEQWLHRDLLFAGSCLAENIKDLKVADNGLCQEILQRLVELEASAGERVGQKVRERVFETLCSLNETDFEAQALHLLKDRAEYVGEWRLQQYQVELGEKDAVIASKLAQLEDKDSWVRGSAASALGKLGNSNPTVIEALLKCFEDESSGVRGSAASALGKLGNSDPTVIETLLKCFKDESSWVRGSAASALGNLANSDPTVIEALLKCFEDEDSWVRGLAASTLGNLANSDPTVIEALLKCFEDEDSLVRGLAASTLGNLANSDPTVIEALLKCFEAHIPHDKM